MCGGLPENLADAIFADPPYFLSNNFCIRTSNGHIRDFDKGEWDRVRTRKKFIHLTQSGLLRVTEY